MTDDERFYCASCYVRLDDICCDECVCPKCDAPIATEADWLSEAEYRKRTAKVDAEVESWNALNAPRAVRK